MPRNDKQSLLKKEGSSLTEKAAKFPWIRVAFFLIVLFCIIFPFTPAATNLFDSARDAYRAQRKLQTPKIVTKEVEVPAKQAPNVKPTPPVSPPVTQPKPPTRPAPPITVAQPVMPIKSDGDIRKLSKGFHFDYKATFQPGGRASTERTKKDSYVAKYTLNVHMPKPATTIEDFSSINPHLKSMLPELDQLLSTAKVSPFYQKLYNNKAARLKKDALQLNKLLTQHNFYDCETMLELTHPKTKRKAFLIQADMDVVSDGSDGDRLDTMPDKIVNSTHYQPFTSYGWKKVTRKPNPMAAGWKKRIGNANTELADSNTSTTRAQWLRGRIKMLKRGIEDMKYRSFLIADHDPFIVISVDMLTARSSGKHIPRVGDYAVVIYKNRILPAIVGDGGPTFKVGEASLRMAKELNPSASSYNRPVSSLGVTYLVFPGSAKRPFAAPNYENWHKECAKLLKDVGGLGEGYDLHQWTSTLPSDEPEDSGDNNE